jgi:hypothetical protein
MGGKNDDGPKLSIAELNEVLRFCRDDLGEPAPADFVALRAELQKLIERGRRQPLRDFVRYLNDRAKEWECQPDGPKQREQVNGLWSMGLDATKAVLRRQAGGSRKRK